MGTGSLMPRKGGGVAVIKKKEKRKSVKALGRKKVKLVRPELSFLTAYAMARKNARERLTGEKGGYT